MKMAERRLRITFGEWLRWRCLAAIRGRAAGRLEPIRKPQQGPRPAPSAHGFRISSMWQRFFGRSGTVAPVADQAFVMQVGDRRQFDAAGTVQTIHHGTGLPGFDHFAFRHRKLADFEHSDIAEFLLDELAKG